MQSTTVGKYVHCIPKAVSLFGLLGLAGAAVILAAGCDKVRVLPVEDSISYLDFQLKSSYDPII